MENQRRSEEIIKTTARKHILDAEVLLFGSRARKNFDSESDYDILIVTHKNFSPREKLVFRTNIRKDLLQSDIRSDILIQSHKELEQKKKLPGHIIKAILNDSIHL
jgi:uncharacterized protein